MQRLVLLASLLAVMAFAADSRADVVGLQNATATFSQSGFSVANTIDGNATANSWSVFGSGGDGNTSAQTAAWETQVDVGFAGGTLFTFELLHTDVVPIAGHNLGRFRLSYTTDSRTEFADGLINAGDVSASWIVLDPIDFSSDTGETFTELGDDSLLVSGGTNGRSTYTVTASTSAIGVTGFRLEVLEDPSLPTGGPGRQFNGNFALSEFTIDAASVAAIPEPNSLILAGLCGCAAIAGSWRRRTIGRTPLDRSGTPDAMS